jgi:hypothetical protein
MPQPTLLGGYEEDVEVWTCILSLAPLQNFNLPGMNADIPGVNIYFSIVKFRVRILLTCCLCILELFMLKLLELRSDHQNA